MKLINKSKNNKKSEIDGVFEYLQLLCSHHPITLKKRCFIAIICKMQSQDRNHLQQLPLEIKEELIHFMLEYRLFNAKLAGLVELIEVLLDPRIKSLDFSVVRSKISQVEPTKELLRSAHRIQKLDFSYCYEINDQILKMLLHNSQKSPALASNGSATNGHSVVGIEGGSANTPTISPLSTPNPTPPATPTKKPPNRLQKLKERILKKRGTRTGGFGDLFKLSSESSTDDNHAVVIPIDLESTSSGGNTGNSSNGMSGSGSSHSGYHGEDSGLEILSIRQCTSFSDIVLRRLLRSSPSIAYLDLTGTKLSTKSLLTITTNCLKLRTLFIGSLSESFSSQSITSTFCNLTQLTNLDISYNSKIDHSALISILTNHNQSSQTSPPLISVMPTLTNSNSSITNTSTTNPINASTTSFSSFSSSGTFGINHSMSHQSLSSMVSVGSSSLSINTNRTMAVDEARNIVVAYPMMIQNLNLAQLDIDDETLSMLPKKCPLLHTLDISYCKKIGDDAFIDMTANGMITLRSLTAKVIKVSMGFVSLFKTNPLLSKLDIRYSQIQESQLNEISSHLNNLRILRVDGTPISDSIFRSISSSNRCLEEIGLSQCKNISFELFNILADNCKSLRKLFLSHCRMGTFSLVSAINFFNNSNRLKTLDICYSPMVCDDFLMAMANSQSAAHLESLFIGGGFQHLEGETITRLIDRCPNIRVFSCISCFKIKDSVIIDAMKRWLVLEALELTDCTSLTPNTINFVSLDSHIHYHLRFIFFGSAIGEEIDEQYIINKIDGKTTIEVLETQQQVTLEDIIEQGWLNI